MLCKRGHDMKRMLLVCLCLCLTVGCARRSGVSTEGSTSMERVIGTLAEAFEAETKIRVTYNPTGSGAGIQAVLSGRCDIGLSSRELTEAERAQGLQTSLLAYDGIAIVVHPDNPVREMDLQTLAAVFTGEIENWKALGGADAPIVPIGREAGGGTRDGFEAATQTVGRCKYRRELTSSGDVMTTVSQNPNAIGYTSASAVKGNVTVLSIDGAQPTKEALQDGSYRIYRPFLLVYKGALGERAQAFFDYVTSPVAAQYIEAAGVVAAGGGA